MVLYQYQFPDSDTVLYYIGCQYEGGGRREKMGEGDIELCVLFFAVSFWSMIILKSNGL